MKVQLGNGKRRWRGGVLAIACGMGLVVATAGTAAAAEQSWLWELSGGNNIGVGSYTDANDVMHVNDQEADNRSLVLDVWKVGAFDGVHYRCWDSTGASSPGVRCEDAFRGSGWGVNAQLRGRLCRGEAGGPGGGTLTSCQPERQWKTFYR
ncbi:hypothetical protein HPO96_09470 [Kribbella sandramycini]|uniref:Uncharacterized protein n=1 Tax=Kribbella sandramycini TaxID=60450 RepID=A0A7Y4NY15_9ACTN|nr:hypothetical protein [Kribbella sandramycini]MBB6569697.1 hypothetical protein [Kribbella sandramycini]NOL40472.1 hypothetical protein [Kribbella sandramycini]